MKRPLGMAGLVFALTVMIVLKLFPPPVRDYTEADGRELLLQGRVYQKEYRKAGTLPAFILYLQSVSVLSDDNTSNSLQLQNVMCYMQQAEEPKMGSVVRIRGKFRAFEPASNPGEFDSRQYYRILRIDGRLKNGVLEGQSKEFDRMKETLYCIRKWLAGRLEHCFAEEEASLMKTMLLGEKGCLPDEIKDLYKKNGIVHILAISGLHLSMLGMGLYRLLRKAGVPMAVSAVCSMVGMYFYGVMTGMGTSAFRAVCMFMLHMLAICVGRTYDLLTALSVAAVLLLIEQPLYLYHSGFLLSFSSVLGIGVMQPVLAPYLKGKWEALGAGLGITLMTFPVQLYFYYEIPVYAVFLNFVVLPLVPVVMTAGMLAVVSPQRLCLMHRILNDVNHIIFFFYEKGCCLMQSLPMHTWVAGQPEIWQIAAYYLIFTLLMIFHEKVSGKWLLFGIVCSIFLVTVRGKSGFRVTVLDVGQGDCIHIQSESGRHYLIDGGSSSKSNIGQYTILPYLKSQGIDRLEAVFVTHTDSDHCNGIAEILAMLPEESLTIGRLILPAPGGSTGQAAYADMVRLAEQAGVPVCYINRGEGVRDGSLQLICMHPKKDDEITDSNEASLVLLVSCGKVTGLLTGDVENAGEQETLQYLEPYLRKTGIGNLTFLKVAHHGSRNATGEDFLAALKPEIAILSYGKDNRYGHPHEEVVTRLAECGADIYRTPDSGAVTIQAGGKQIGVREFSPCMSGHSYR